MLLSCCVMKSLAVINSSKNCNDSLGRTAYGEVKIKDVTYNLTENKLPVKSSRTHKMVILVTFIYNEFSHPDKYKRWADRVDPTVEEIWQVGFWFHGRRRLRSMRMKSRSDGHRTFFFTCYCMWYFWKHPWVLTSPLIQNSWAGVENLKKTASVFLQHCSNLHH